MVAEGAPSSREQAIVAAIPAERALRIATAIAERGGIDELRAGALVAAVSAAARVAAGRWLRPASDGLVVAPSTPLADALREGLAHVAPALEAVSGR